MKSRSGLLVRILVLISMITGALPRAALAQRVGSDVIGIFPKDVGELGFVDLKAARSQKSLGALEVQYMPDALSQIQALLAAERIDLMRDADQVVWGFIPAYSYSSSEQSSSEGVVTGEQIVGIALGQYNPESSDAYLKQTNVGTTTFGGVTLFTLQTTTGPNDLFAAYLNSSTLAFGHRVALQKMLEVRAGMTSGLVANTGLFQLIEEVNGTGALWAVMDSFYSRSAVGQLTPDLTQIAQSSELLKNMKNMAVRVAADGAMEGELQIVLNSTDDANALGQLLQIGLLYENYQANNKQNKALADLLNRAQVLPAGDRVKLRLVVNENEVPTLPGILTGSGSSEPATTVGQ